MEVTEALNQQHLLEVQTKTRASSFSLESPLCTSSARLESWGGSLTTRQLGARQPNRPWRHNSPLMKPRCRRGGWGTHQSPVLSLACSANGARKHDHYAVNFREVVGVFSEDNSSLTTNLLTRLSIFRITWWRGGGQTERKKKPWQQLWCFSHVQMMKGMRGAAKNTPLRTFLASPLAGFINYVVSRQEATEQ